MAQIEGKTAIVTGGGTGIGRGIALALGQEGVHVMVCGRRQPPLSEVVDAITQAGGRASSLQADVSNLVDVDHLVAATLDAFGTVDFLINNAGISGGGHIHEHEVEEWDRILATNLRAPFLLSRAVLPILRQKRSGHIINISSESGLEYYLGDGAYGISKHALNALSEYIQRENQELGIRVDTICPGMVVSEMSIHSPGLNLELCLTPEDIADLVVWLLTRRENVKIGTPVLIQTMLNPWGSD